MSHALPKSYSFLNLRSAAPLLSWRENWEFHFYRQERAVVLSRYGRVFLEHVTRAVNILENGPRLLGEQTGQNPESYPLAFFTHSELKWFRD
jgi:hypothetical protein